MKVEDEEYWALQAGEIAYSRYIGYNARCDYKADGRLLGYALFGQPSPKEWDEIHERYENETTGFDYGFDANPR
jgi:hypothetical protein